MSNKEKDKSISGLEQAMKLLTMVVLTITIVAIIMYPKQVKDEKMAFEDTSVKVLNHTKNLLNMWIESQHKVVDTIANDPRVIDALLNPEDEEKLVVAEEYLQSMLERYPYSETVPIALKTDKDIIRNVNGEDVIISNGEFLMDPNRLIIGEGGPDYSYISSGLKGEDIHVSDVYRSITSGAPIFVVSKPIYHENEVIGVALISPRIDYITENFIKAMQFQETGYVFFFDERYITIAHKRSDFILKYADEIDKNLKSLMSSFMTNDGVVEGKFRGDDKLYYTMKVIDEESIMKSDWFITYTMEKDEIFFGSNRLLSYISIMVVISISCLTILIYFIYRMDDKSDKEDLLLMENEKLEKKISERNLQIKKMANTDEITNLMNKDLLMENLERCIAETKKAHRNLSLIVFDLDNFKCINETFGYAIGDIVLEAIGDIVSDSCREGDVSGRYSNKEFVLLLPNCDITGAVTLADRIKEQISSKKFNIKEIKVTASFGVLTWDNESPEAFVEKAINLLEVAKSKGSNNLEYKKFKNRSLVI